MTDTLRLIAKNTGEYYTKRYSEAVERKPEDNRTAEEITADIVERAGLVVRK